MARRGGLAEGRVSVGAGTSREQEVYGAALRLFREKGYHATSMQDIALAVGMRKGSLYHYIGGKEDFLVHVFARALGSLVDDLERIATDDGLNPSEQLRQAIRAHVCAVAENLDALTVYLHEWRALDGEGLEGVRAQRERYVALFEGIVVRGADEGTFHTSDARIATLGILGMCNWLSQWYRPDGRLPAPRIAEHFAVLALRGLERHPPFAPPRLPQARRSSKRV